MEDSDHAITGDLPMLWDSTEWVAGFQNIVDHVDDLRVANRWSSGLDRSAPPDAADVTAYVESTVRPGRVSMPLWLKIQ